MREVAMSTERATVGATALAVEEAVPEVVAVAATAALASERVTEVAAAKGLEAAVAVACGKAAMVAALIDALDFE